jgi:hypothetical protein
VLCEKPIGLDMERATEAARYADRSGTRAMVDVNRRFDRDYAELKPMAAGEIGAVELIQLTRRGPTVPPLDAIAIFGVSLQTTKQCGDGLTSRLFGSGLINSQLRGQLVHRDVSQDVVNSTRGLSLSAGCHRQRPVEWSCQDTTAGVRTFARHWAPVGSGYALIASTPTSLCEPVPHARGALQSTAC